MRVLVLGGTGFIGNRVVCALKANRHLPGVFCRMPIPGSHTFSGDRGSRHALRQAIEVFDPDTIVDLLARTESEARVLLEVLRGRSPHVVVASSVDVYEAYEVFGRVSVAPIDATPIHEDARLRRARFPRRRKARTQPTWEQDYEKIDVERVIRSGHVPFTLLRLPFVYGPADYRNRLSPYVEAMVGGALEVRIPRNLAQWRCTRAYVADVADAIVTCIERSEARQQTFNVGESEALTETQWVRAIGKAVGWEGSVVETMDRSDGCEWRQPLHVDTTRIRRVLRYEERRTREQALRETVVWKRTE